MNLFAIFLTLIFIYLKLTGAILWAWLWVLAPLWILWLAVPLASVLLLIILGTIVQLRYKY